MPAAPRMSTNSESNHAECRSVRQQDGEYEVDGGDQRPQQEDEDDEDARRARRSSPGSCPGSMRPAGREARPSRPRPPHRSLPASRACRMSLGGVYRLRTVGTGVEYHLKPRRSAVAGDVGVAQGLETLVVLEIELGEEDRVGPGGEGSALASRARRRGPRVATSASCARRPAAASSTAVRQRLGHLRELRERGEAFW